jgi:tetratricopeptide (TPR) repeat protein
MIRALILDPAWTLVYHDEVAVIFVRGRGNEAVIEKARKLYPAWRSRISAALNAPPPRWQRPVGRVKALSSYASLLFLIGETEKAIELEQRLLAFPLPATQESRAHIIIGSYLANRGELKRALGHLERAARLDPSNKPLREMIQSIRNADPSDFKN